MTDYHSTIMDEKGRRAGGQSESSRFGVHGLELQMSKILPWSQALHEAIENTVSVQKNNVEYLWPQEYMFLIHFQYGCL